MTGSRLSRLLAAASVLITFAFTSLLAQSQEAAGLAKKNSLEKGAWAIQFQIDSDAILTSFGGAFAVKKHRSDRSAYRLGINFGFTVDDIEQKAIDLSQDPDGTLATQNSDRDSENIALFLHYLRYTSPGAPVNFFWGIGPYGGFARSKDLTENDSSVTTGSTERLTKQWTVGIEGRLGVELFATRTLSFHAEYSASTYFIRSTQENESSGPDGPRSRTEITSNGWRLSRGSVLFGLSAYF